MKTKFLIALLVLLLAAAEVGFVLLAPEIRLFIEQDRCLDAGGAWDETTGQCVGIETN